METTKTLFDFMTYTKGVTYLLAVLFMVGFTFFWLFLVDRDKK